MADLPLVLAGPIVRRVEARACSFWVALRDPATVTATVWAGTQSAGAGPESVGSGDAPRAAGQAATRRFGQKLHVAVVTVELAAPTPPLQPGGLFSYDLTFAGGFGTETLRTVGLLRNEAGNPRITGVDDAAPKHLALGYVTNRLPSFVTPSGTIGGLRLAHASCRKTMGPGYDAMAWLDEPIGAHFEEPGERLQQLFLTGDQIYGDEMSSCLLSMLVALGADVVGGEELAVDGATSIDAALGNFQLFRRQRLVRELAGFTSIEAHDHLLSFREYAAMYLLAWSPRVWRPLGTIDEVFSTVPGAAHPSVQGHLSDWEACAATEKPPTTYRALHEELVTTYRDRVEVYRDAVPHVARVLANCATYMIFDDHEVTDDWNLNKTWQNRVYSKALGRNIVRNGVMAYAVFQGWGNDPAAHESGKNKELLDETEKVFAGAGPYPSAGADLPKLDQLTGCTAVAADTATFSYRVPGPRHLAVVLDTRTRRTFTGQGLHPPNLLGDSLDNQVPAGPLTDGRELLLVVSPAPVLGPHLIERIGQPLAQIVWDAKNSVQDLFKGPAGPCEPQGRDAGAEHFDAESWIGDEVAFEKLLTRLAAHGRAVILSGDVHYGGTLVLDHWRKGVADPSRIVQLTSSPARNEFKPIVEAILRSSALLQRYQVGPKPERLAWNGKASITLPGTATIGPGRRARMNRTPALVPARLWPAGTTIPDDKPPDWRWRLSLMVDQRPETVRPPALRQPALGQELDAADPLVGYRQIAARHAQAALTHLDHLRQLVFTQNVGIIDLAEDGAGTITVTHTLLSKDAPESTTSSDNTVHVVSLAPTTDARPELVTRG